MDKIAQILVAAGKGARFSSDIPKQYVEIDSKPLLRWTLDACLKACPITDIFAIIISPDDKNIETALEGFDAPFIIIKGGDTRTQSVRAGIMALAKSAPDIVFIHDAARPFVTKALYDHALAALKASSGAVPILPLIDAVKSFKDETIGADIDRNTLARVQTPQVFRYKDIAPLYKALGCEADFSDDISIAQTAGLTISAFPGDAANIKITYPEDIKVFKNMAIKQNHDGTNSKATYTATGSGFDVHRTESGDHVWLCGVKINAPFGLEGHSDADVGLHALTDAILGALCAGDIGDHFPPSDPKWKGVSSDVFLTHCANLTLQKGGQIDHVDVTLICETPKINTHKQAMRETIARILSISPMRVSVKATTSEKLGFTGRGEGIAAQAIATLRLPRES